MHMLYWQQLSRTRLQRRRILATAAAATAASAIIAACGGKSSGGTHAQPQDKGILTKPEDTYSKAVRGGVLKEYSTREASTFDPVAPVGPLNDIAKYAFGTLLAEQPGYLK